MRNWTPTVRRACGRCGCWSGAATPGELARLAPVLAGSADLGHHPYRLGAALEPQSLAAALTAKAADPQAEAEVPFPATAGVLAALAGLPRAEVPGLRVLGASRFDVTSETGTATGDAGLSLGVILDAQDRPAGEFLLPLPTLNRHALVTGATGAGKSQTVRHLLAGLTRAGLPWLAIEPVKAEYPGMAGRLAGLGPAGAVTVLNPADPEAIGVSVNPLAPERGYPGAGSHRHGPCAVPGRVRRRRAVPADHRAGVTARLRGERLGRGDRRPAARRRGRAGRAHARAAPAGRP